MARERLLDEILDRARVAFERGGLRHVNLESVEGAAELFEDDAALRRALVLAAAGRSIDAIHAQVAAAPDGESALQGFLRAHLGVFSKDIVWTAIHLSSTQPDAAELLAFDDDSRRQILDVQDGLWSGVEEKLVADWGADLPQGIHPRRLAFTGYNAMMGLLAITLAARSMGLDMRHSPDDMIDEMYRALGSPNTVMRQLAALNEVAGRLAAMREEEALVEAVPALLCASLEVDFAVLMRPDEADHLAVRAAFPDDAAEHLVNGASSLRGAYDDGRTLFVEEGERTYIASPVRSRGEVFAVLVGGVPSGGRRLDRRDVSRFETFAAMVGLALENARWVSLIQREKMASLSKLVAGVAHDLNTPLGALISGTDLSSRALPRLRRAIESGDTKRVERILSTLEDSHATAQRACERIDERVRGLRRFAHLDQAERQRANLNDCIDSTLLMMSLQLADVTVHTDYGELPEIDCYPNELNQVFMNLLLNAATATGGAGTLWLRTTRDDGELRLCFQDDGRGIAGDELARIFDPGFTNWQVGVGSGLGLSTCRSIIDRHEGRIEVQSEVGSGSTFTVHLPV